MTKRIRYTILFISFAYSALGQPVLTAESIDFQVGDEYTMYDALYELPSAAGAGVTWDFSGLSDTSSISMRLLEPSTTPAGNNFPSSTVAWHSFRNPQLWRYYTQEAGALVEQGLTELPNSVVYSDEKRLFDYPLEYGDVFTDQFAGTYNSGGLPIDRSGTVNCEIDGYGTIITPIGTFTDVLRVKIVEDYTDITFGTTVIDLHTETYYWFKAWAHFPIAININGSNNGFAFQSMQYTDAPMSIEEANYSNVTVYPNPSANYLIVSENDFHKAEYEISDMFGKIVNKGLLLLNRIDLNTLSSGIYTLKLTSSDKAIGISRFQVLK
jgi:hypothetical protein